MMFLLFIVSLHVMLNLKHKADHFMIAKTCIMFFINLYFPHSGMFVDKVTQVLAYICYGCSLLTNLSQTLPSL